MPENKNEPRIIICNSGPLIALAGIHRLELLHDIYKVVLVPEAVYREVTCLPRLLGAQNITDCSWICRVSLLSKPDKLLTSQLGMGEAEVITLALEKKSHKVLIDEKKARRIAGVIYGLNVTGTGGILLRAKKEGYVDAVRPLMQEMRDNGYYLSDRLIERIAMEAGESNPDL